MDVFAETTQTRFLIKQHVVLIFSVIIKFITALKLQLNIAQMPEIPYIFYSRNRVKETFENYAYFHILWVPFSILQDFLNILWQFLWENSPFCSLYILHSEKMVLYSVKVLK